MSLGWLRCRQHGFNGPLRRSVPLMGQVNDQRIRCFSSTRSVSNRYDRLMERGVIQFRHDRQFLCVQANAAVDGVDANELNELGQNRLV